MIFLEGSTHCRLGLLAERPHSRHSLYWGSKRKCTPSERENLKDVEKSSYVDRQLHMQEGGFCDPAPAGMQPHALGGPWWDLDRRHACHGLLKWLREREHKRCFVGSTERLIRTSVMKARRNSQVTTGFCYRVAVSNLWAPSTHS